MRLGRSRRSDASLDDRREQRLESVKRLVERFVHDLALLMARHPAALEEYLAPAAAARLRGSLEPFLATGDAMRPNFGEYGELRVEGDLLALGMPLIGRVEFDDQSVRETAAGELLPAARRRIRLTLTIAPDATRITDFRLERRAPAA